MFAFLIEGLWHPRVVELLLFKSTEMRVYELFFPFAERENETVHVAGKDMLIDRSEIFNFAY